MTAKIKKIVWVTALRLWAVNSWLYRGDQNISIAVKYDQLITIRSQEWGVQARNTKHK